MRPIRARRWKSPSKPPPLATLPGHAGTVTTTFGVSTTISGVCVVSTASSGLSFGAYDPTSSSDTLGTTTFKVQCSSGLGYTIGLSAGGSGTDTARTMSSGGATPLNYNLYSDAGRATNWGASTGAATGTGAGLTLRPRLPSRNQREVQ